MHVLRKRRMPRLADLEQLAYALPSWCSVTEPSAPSAPAKRRKVAPVAPAGPSEGLTDSCKHCGQAHGTRRCTFGARATERFLPCEGVRPHGFCFWRRFLVPLQRADALAPLGPWPCGA